MHSFVGFFTLPKPLSILIFLGHLFLYFFNTDAGQSVMLYGACGLIHMENVDNRFPVSPSQVTNPSLPSLFFKTLRYVDVEMAPLFFSLILLFFKASSGLYFSKRSVISWKYSVCDIPSCFAPHPIPSSQSLSNHPSSFPSVYEFDVQCRLFLNSPVIELAEYGSEGEHPFHPVRGLMIDWRCLMNLGLCVSGSTPQNSFGTPFELPALQNIGAQTYRNCKTSSWALATEISNARIHKLLHSIVRNVSF